MLYLLVAMTTIINIILLITITIAKTTPVTTTIIIVVIIMVAKIHLHLLIKMIPLVISKVEKSVLLLIDIVSSKMSVWEHLEESYNV